MKVAEQKKADLGAIDRRRVKVGKAWAATNALTGEQYAQTNIDFLEASAKQAGYSSTFWATFAQWQALGCFVKKGSKGTRIYCIRHGRPWYHYLFNLNQVHIPDNPPAELRDALNELIDLDRDDEIHNHVMKKTDLDAAHWARVCRATGKQTDWQPGD
jgi:hypothetical protein